MAHTRKELKLEDGKYYMFDNDVFLEKVKEIKKKRNISFEKIDEEISKKIIVSKSTVTSWRKNKTGPSDIKMIRNLGLFFDCDYHEFLKPSLKKTMIKKKNANRNKQQSIDHIVNFYEKVIEIKSKFNSIFNKERQRLEFKGFVILFLIIIVFVYLNKYIKISYALIELFIVIYGIFIMVCPLFKFIKKGD